MIILEYTLRCHSKEFDTLKRKLNHRRGGRFYYNRDGNGNYTIQIVFKGEADALKDYADTIETFCKNGRIEYERKIREEHPVQHKSKEYQKLVSEYKKLEKVCDSVKAKAHDLERELEEKKMRISELEAELEKAEQRFENFKEEVKATVIEFVRNPDYESLIKAVREYNQRHVEAIKNYVEASKLGIIDKIGGQKEIPKVEPWERTAYYRNNKEKYVKAKRVLKFAEVCKEKGIEIDENALAMPLKQARSIVKKFEKKKAEHEKKCKIAEYANKELRRPLLILPPFEELSKLLEESDSRIVEIFKNSGVEIALDGVDSLKVDVVAYNEIDHGEETFKQVIRMQNVKLERILDAAFFAKLLEIFEEEANKYKGE